MFGFDHESGKRDHGHVGGDPADKAYVKSVGARTRAALGDARFERLLATERELALDEALAQMQQYLKEEP
ncbi:MAG TPA: hypothetical protein VN325_18610 [Steroidobacteraceae bacterium]|nr:hypothetical protein [Steroidobacteraceae bacterium]